MNRFVLFVLTLGVLVAPFELFRSLLHFIGRKRFEREQRRRWNRAVAPTVFVMLLSLFGCGDGPPKEAQTVLTAAAISLVDADRIHEAALAAAADIAIQEAETMEEWQQRMTVWVRSTRALETAADALRAMQHSLNAWEAGSGDRGDFIDAAACLFPVLRLVSRQLSIHGLNVPESIDNALQLVAPFVEGACPTIEINEEDFEEGDTSFRDVRFFSFNPRRWQS